MRLLADARDDGRLAEFDFLSAALVAGGVEQECQLDGWRGDYVARRAAMVEWARHEFPKRKRLAALHAAMHQRVLVGRYDATASDLRQTLARGDYNCLSAVAIFYDMCQAAEIELEIWAAPGHVYLRSGEGETIEPGIRELGVTEQGDIIERLTPPARLADARRITPVELLGRFYYNRGVLALRASEFSTGTALLRTSLRLDPRDADARENLLAGINNWAVAEIGAKRYGRAAELIADGLAIDKTYSPLVANERLVRSASQ
jgi:hypothetical protein